MATYLGAFGQELILNEESEIVCVAIIICQKRCDQIGLGWFVISVSKTFSLNKVGKPKSMC